MSMVAIDPERPSLGQWVTWACLWEATAAKPGNVHRGADFEDVTFAHFVTSSSALGGVVDRWPLARPGELALRGVTAMRATVATNTHLGTLLLLAPLVVAARGQGGLRAELPAVLQALDAEDARRVYEAIRLARPGGLGQVAEGDVAGEAPADLLQAMGLAAARDLVARQYVTGFATVLDFVVPALQEGVHQGRGLNSAIVWAYVRLLAAEPDSLIARKCGLPAAQQASALAQRALAAGTPGQEDYQQALGDLDFWLRSDGHRRNPGTTADLVAGGLFVAGVEGIITWPLAW